MTNRKFSFKATSLLVVLAVFLSTFCAVLPVSATARGAWAPNTAYAVNDTVTYSGSTYTCRQAHTSLVGWEPPIVPALWEKGGSGTTPPTTPPTNPSVTKPSEVPSHIWTYAVNADNKFGKGGDFALLLSAVIKKESSFGAGLPGSPSAGDGLMQVEPNTRNAYLSQFSSKFGRAYNHSSEQDQVYLGALILNEKIVKFGNIYNGLLHYNGGDNWYPGATDSYGRPILANQYADAVYSTYKGYGGKN